jgi:hypothetical protein
MNRAALPKDTLLELMAYADGELAGEERARAERLIAENADAKRFVASLGVLGSHVRREEAELGSLPADGIADAVMARIGGAQAGVVDLAAARAQRSAAVRGPGRSAWKFGVVAVAAALALAAGAVFMLRGEQLGAQNDSPRPPGQHTSLLPSPLPSPRSPSPSKENVLASIVAGVDVESLDAPQAVSVFYVPAMNAAANANASSVVVWIEEEVKP